MGFLAVSAVFCLCLSSALATYGPDYKHHGSNHYNNGHSNGGKLDESTFHLNSPKIILDRPSINVHGGPHGPLHEDEPIILENEEPLYIRKTLHAEAPAVHHAAPAVHQAATSVLLDTGYSHGKVLDITAPIQVINHAPIVHERPILIRRPVYVSKGLTTTQDHLEKLHYAHHGGVSHHNGYNGHYAIPLARALHEKTVVYSGIDHGHVAPIGYSAPLILADNYHKAHLGHAAYGKALYHQGAILHHGPALQGHGGPILHHGNGGYNRNGGHNGNGGPHKKY